MSIGSSGRIVIEIAPPNQTKSIFRLNKKVVTLKDWFLDCAGKCLTDPTNQQTDDEGNS